MCAISFVINLLILLINIQTSDVIYLILLINLVLRIQRPIVRSCAEVHIETHAMREYVTRYDE
jgi:hypothetical protein